MKTHSKNLILPAMVIFAVAAGSDTVIAADQAYEQSVMAEFLYTFYYYDLETTFVQVDSTGFGAGAADQAGLLEQAVFGDDNYVMAARCDTDCPDIDIAVIDGNGITLSTDETDGAFAQAPFTPDFDQPLSMRITVDDCTTPLALRLRPGAVPAGKLRARAP